MYIGMNSLWRDKDIFLLFSVQVVMLEQADERVGLNMLHFCMYIYADFCLEIWYKPYSISYDAFTMDYGGHFHLGFDATGASGNP